MLTQKDIDDYKQLMIEWIVEHTDKKYEEIKKMFDEDKDKMDKALFDEYPEVTFHYDPAKFAELWAVSMGIMEEPPIEFVEDN